MYFLGGAFSAPSAEVAGAARMDRATLRRVTGSAVRCRVGSLDLQADLQAGATSGNWICMDLHVFCMYLVPRRVTGSAGRCHVGSLPRWATRICIDLHETGSLPQPLKP